MGVERIRILMNPKLAPWTLKLIAAELVTHEAQEWRQGIKILCLC